MVRRIIKQCFKTLGYELRRIKKIAPASDERPVGRMDFIIEDLYHRGLRCDLIMDVGANRCQWSEMAAKIFPNAKFCLIEPQQEMEYKLRSFCDKHPGSRYVLSGAGAANETRTLTVWDDLAGSSFLPNKNEALLEAGKQRQLPVVTIDSILADLAMKPPELMKLDVQGFELEVLKGAASTFGKTEVYMLEVSMFSFDDVPGMPVLREVIEFMGDRGYETYDFAGFLRRPFDGALGQCDICFARREGILRNSNRWT